MPAVGRAYIEGLMDTATSADGKPASAHANWAKLGPETKKVLFPDAQVRADLDDFFTLAKKSAESAKPSGAAYVSGMKLMVEHPFTGTPYVLGNNAVARMLFKPGGAKLLRTGLRIPAASGAKAVVASSILKSAGSGAQPLDTPPLAAQSQQQAPTQARTALEDLLPTAADVVHSSTARANELADRFLPRQQQP